jgi:C-terminal processing protease CtpA/Prc
MSTYVKMDNGFEMKVPTSDYVTIKGLRIEGSPLVPDVKTSSGRRGDGFPPSDVKNDKTVAAAIEALRAAAGAHAENPKEGVTIDDGK